MTARRSRNDGSLFFDATRKVWVGTLDLGRDPATGRRRRRKVSAKTKGEARKALDGLKATAKAGTVPRGDLTVRDLLAALLAAPPASWRSPISVRTNTDHAKRATAALGHIRADKLSVSDVEAFLAQMAADGLSTSTIRCTRGVLRLALRRAERDGHLGRNVAALSDVPDGTRRQSGAMTREQVGKLLALDLGPWWRAYLTAAFMTGLRVGELLGLSWSDVDLDAGVIRVRHSLKREDGRLYIGDLKTQSSRRTIQMPEAVAVALKAHRKAQASVRLAAGAAWEDHGLVFPSPRYGKPRWRNLVDRSYKGLCGRAGIGTHWQLRETRHTFVSVLSAAGVPIEAIADAAGHVNSQITRTVYRHQLGDTITTAAVTWDALAAGSVAQ